MHKIQVVCLLAVVLRVEVKLWKHLDPTQVSDLTLEPWFLRLTIKKKVFQLRFLEEVLCDRYSMKVEKSFSHISYRSTKSYIMNKALSWLFFIQPSC